MRCRGCDREIAVEWWCPNDEHGKSLPPILENLCNTCRKWADISQYSKPIESPPDVEEIEDVLSTPYAERTTGDC